MRRSQSGMTFLEVMTVVIITAVMTVFTIPNLKGPHEFNKMRASAREIISLMRYARSMAVLHEVEVAMEFDVEENNYRLDLDQVGKKMERRERRKMDKAEETNWRALQKNVNFLAVASWDAPAEKGIARIVFYPDGSASDATIVLENEMKQHMSVELNRATALAEVTKGLPEDWDEIKDNRRS